VALVPLEIRKIGLVMENARLVRWLKKVGETVTAGEPLAELETEKSVVEIESTESGRLVEILLGVDQEARVGDKIAWLEVDSAAAVPSKHDEAPAAQAARAAPAATRTVPKERIYSSPAARRLAAEHAVDLRPMTGTGPRGRVQLIDVRRAIESENSREVAASGAPHSLPLSSMRRAVARSTTLSNATVPQFIVERAVEWTALESVRAKLLARLAPGAPSPSVNDFLLQAIARALLAFQDLNATFSGDANSSDAAIVPASGAHIGLVVAVDKGLLVAVFHDVQQFGILELARRRADLVQRALRGTLKPEELEGATFSVSNLGARGPDRFTAIISPPQSAILAVGRRRDCVVAAGGGILVKPMSQLTLTVDHRVADGRLAADFLAYLVDIVAADDWRLD
jgi:pyruvate dehydrogenase E2 component (dihydrolipoamide acetyltransferase)